MGGVITVARGAGAAIALVLLWALAGAGVIALALGTLVGLLSLLGVVWLFGGIDWVRDHWWPQ